MDTEIRMTIKLQKKDLEPFLKVMHDFSENHKESEVTMSGGVAMKPDEFKNILKNAGFKGKVSEMPMPPGGKA